MRETNRIWKQAVKTVGHFSPGPEGEMRSAEVQEPDALEATDERQRAPDLELRWVVDRAGAFSLLKSSKFKLQMQTSKFRKWKHPGTAEDDWGTP